MGGWQNITPPRQKIIITEKATNYFKYKHNKATYLVKPYLKTDKQMINVTGKLLISDCEGPAKERYTMEIIIE